MKKFLVLLGAVGAYVAARKHPKTKKHVHYFELKAEKKAKKGYEFAEDKVKEVYAGVKQKRGCFFCRFRNK